MRHLIIGKGNLGLDLRQALSARGDMVVISGRGEADHIDHDFIWVTAGYGSIDKCKENPLEAFNSHVLLPLEVCKKANPETKIVCFSTDYAIGEPLSLYATTKASMEVALKTFRPWNTSVVRVCSLYGEHFPERTFPGRLLRKYPNPCEVTLPPNLTTPTPTSWIARVLADNLFAFGGNFKIVHCAPVGNLSIAHWGQLVLGDKYQISLSDYDRTRPLNSNLGCSFGSGETCASLWQKHFNREVYV